MTIGSTVAGSPTPTSDTIFGMEGRRPVELRLEMSDLDPDEYRERRRLGGAERITVFVNQRRGRRDLPRTIPEFDTLGVVEGRGAGPAPEGVRMLRMVRTPRPGQGFSTGEPTNGIQLVLISPKAPSGERSLRDWGDFVHIRHIAEAAVPGFRMITPYVNPTADGPRFLHLYEMHTEDPEAAFQVMTPLVAARLGGADTDAYRDWAWHPQLRIDYVNTFARVD